MSRRIGRHIRSNVVGYVAVFMSLCIGTAWAGTPNSVVSGDIVNGEVKTPDIAQGAVKALNVGGGAIRSNKVLDDTNPAGGLEQQDLKSNSVGSSEIQTDAVQATEVADNSIDGGEIVNDSMSVFDLGFDSVRASELGTITQRSQVSATIPGGGNGSVTASCLAGEQVVSGGNDGFFDVFVVASRQAGNGWAVFAHNQSGSNRTITAHAYCLAASP